MPFPGNPCPSGILFAKRRDGALLLIPFAADSGRASRRRREVSNRRLNTRSDEDGARSHAQHVRWLRSQRAVQRDTAGLRRCAAIRRL